MKRSIYWVDFANNNPHFVNLAALWLARLDCKLKAYVSIRDGFAECVGSNKSLVRIPFRPVGELGVLGKLLMLINISSLAVRSILSAKLNGISGVVYSTSWRFPKLDDLYLRLVKLVNLRAVLLIHEVQHHENTSSMALIRSAARRCDCLLAMSEHSRNEIAGVLDIPVGDIQVTHHPNYDPLFEPVDVDVELHDELVDWLDGHSLLLLPSTITEKRGSHFIETYVEQIVAEKLSYKILVIGRDQEAALASRLKLCEERHPKYLKVVARRYTNEELKAALKLATCVVLPYIDVMQSGVCPLAFGEGVPVLATRIGSFVEVIDPDVNGALVDLSDLPDFNLVVQGLAGLSVDQAYLVRESLEAHYSGNRFVSDLLSALCV